MCFQSKVWSLKSEVRSLKLKVRSQNSEFWSQTSDVRSEFRRTLSEIRSHNNEVSPKSEVLSSKIGKWEVPLRLAYFMWITKTDRSKIKLNCFSVAMKLKNGKKLTFRLDSRLAHSGSRLAPETTKPSLFKGGRKSKSLHWQRCLLEKLRESYLTVKMTRVTGNS